MWKLNNMHPNNPWTKEYIKRNLKNLTTNKNGNRALRNLKDVANTVLRGKFIPINADVVKIERFQINNLFYTSRNKKNK